MNELVPSHVRPTRISRDDMPKKGEWYWVKHNHYDSRKNDHVESEDLFCVARVRSNHVVFVRPYSGSDSMDDEKVHFRDIADRTRIEPSWQKILESQISETQAQLTDAIKSLALLCASAGATEPESQAPTADATASMLRNSLVEYSVCAGRQDLHLSGMLCRSRHLFKDMGKVSTDARQTN